jgi:hypothetical protein
LWSISRTLQASRPDRFLNFVTVTVVVSDRVVIPGQLTHVLVLGRIMKFKFRQYFMISSLSAHLFSTFARQSSFLQGFRTMAPQTNQSQVPNDPFRVLIIGRANAGKTSILQRVCDTTESPTIYRVDTQGQRSQVRSRSRWPPQSHRLVRFDLTLQLRFDRHILVRDR